MTERDSKHLDVVEKVVSTLSADEREELLRWANELNDLRRKNLPVLAKGTEALAITKRHAALAPILKALLLALRRIGWDERTWVGKLGISGSLIGLILLNTATGGFAAFGTAIAVPLWMVLGGGGMLLGQLIETLRHKTPPERNGAKKRDADR
jgi:hypothetical protein